MSALHYRVTHKQLARIYSETLFARAMRDIRETVLIAKVKLSSVYDKYGTKIPQGRKIMTHSDS